MRTRSAPVVEPLASPDPATTAWVPIYNVGQTPVVPPVVNGQWLKGVGGAAVWSAITPADVANVPYGTTLPASPYDGQEAILVDSTTNPSYQWRFRWNAGSTEPNGYKWGFVGGSPAYIRCPDYAVASQNVWEVGAGTFTLPRTGRYICETQATATSTPNTSIQYVGVAIAGSILDPYIGGTVSPAGNYLPMHVRATGAGSVGAVVAGYFNSAYWVGSFGGRDLVVIPIRVA